MIYTRTEGDVTHRWDLGTSTYTRTHGEDTTTRPFTPAERSWADGVLARARMLDAAAAARDALVAGMTTLTAARDGLAADISRARTLQTDVTGLAGTATLPETRQLAGYVAQLAGHRVTVDRALVGVLDALIRTAEIARTGAVAPTAGVPAP